MNTPDPVPPIPAARPDDRRAFRGPSPSPVFPREWMAARAYLAEMDIRDPDNFDESYCPAGLDMPH